MKNLILVVMIFIASQTISAQSNLPRTTVSGTTTGTENITGNAAPKVSTTKTQEGTETSATSATTSSNAQVNTNYGKNNDGSSTGTTVTGNGAKSDSAPVDDGSPSPGNKGGTMIVTPRGR